MPSQDGGQHPMTEVMTDRADELIAERESTHGPWVEQATIAQMLKETLRQGSKWDQCTLAQREALEMGAVKWSRIVCGNPQEPDHWDDTCGYMRLGTPKK